MGVTVGNPVSAEERKPDLVESIMKAIENAMPRLETEKRVAVPLPSEWKGLTAPDELAVTDQVTTAGMAMGLREVRFLSGVEIPPNNKPVPAVLIGK